MSKTGTREWSEQSINIPQVGCEHGCLYCYARYDAKRWKRIKSGCDWATPRIDTEQKPGDYPKYKGIVMFPTSHDVTALNFKQCLTTLHNLLDVGNHVLIVSKPDIAVWRALLPELETEQDQIELRFSITHMEAATGLFWEPGAPSVEERFMSLRLAHEKGWRTSVSCEPLLEPWNAAALVGTVKPWVTETIWIGAARQLKQRTAWCKDMEGLGVHVANLEAWQTPAVMQRIFNALKDEPKIRWKDSYQKALGLDGPEG